jgi:ATP-dependent RNA helicase DeaD
LVELITSRTSIPSRNLDSVQIFDQFSFITVPFEDAEVIIQEFKKAGRDNRPLVEKAKDSKDGGSSSSGRGPSRDRGPARDRGFSGGRGEGRGDSRGPRGGNRSGGGGYKGGNRSGGSRGPKSGITDLIKGLFRLPKQSLFLYPLII